MSKNIRSLLAASLLSVLILTETAVVKADTKSEILDGRQEIRTISREIRESEEKISRLDNDLIELALEIQANKDELGETQAEITATKGEIAAKQAERDAKQEQFGKRLRSAYKDGGISWIEALLDSESLSDFMLKTKVIRSIAESDQAIISELDELNAELSTFQSELESHKLSTEELLGELKEQDAELSAALEDQKKSLALVETRKAELAELLAGKELELFAEVRDTFNDPTSTIEDITEARTILASLEDFVKSQQALALAEELDSRSSEALKEREEAARRAAEEAARRAEEARLAEAARIEAEEARRAEAAREAEAARQAAAEAERRAQAESTRPAATQPPVTVTREKTEEKKPAPVQVVKKPSTSTSTGEKALAEAKRYLGVPYVYGGASFSGVDCSGLTMRAYAAAGISLSHGANAQYRESRRISRSELRPGDLIFWGYSGEITHVAMYVGDGKQIHAPRPGKSVEIVPLSTSMDYIGAGRPY